VYANYNITKDILGIWQFRNAQNFCYFTIFNWY